MTHHEMLLQKYLSEGEGDFLKRDTIKQCLQILVKSLPESQEKKDIESYANSKNGKYLFGINDAELCAYIKRYFKLVTTLT